MPRKQAGPGKAFDALMGKLVRVPKKELDKEIRKERRKKQRQIYNCQSKHTPHL